VNDAMERAAEEARSTAANDLAENDFEMDSGGGGKTVANGVNLVMDYYCGREQSVLVVAV
jgi:hypothetical protein